MAEPTQVEIEALKIKYPFFQTVLDNGYGAGHSLFEIYEVRGTSGIVNRVTEGASSGGGDFVSWRWDGVKNNQVVDLPRYANVGEVLRTQDLDYILCAEVLTVEFSGGSQTDRTLAIYEIAPGSAK